MGKGMLIRVFTEGGTEVESTYREHISIYELISERIYIVH